MNNNQGYNGGWSDIFLVSFVVWMISGGIGVFLSIFSELLGIIFMLFIPLIFFLIFVYNSFGTKEKRKYQKQLSQQRKAELKKQLYNEDGTKKTQKQINQEKAEKELQRINNLGVYPTKIISKNSVLPIVYIDDNNEKILFKTFYGEYVVNYKDILDFELIVDDTTQIKYGISTAITGTFQSKGVVSKILVKVYLNNIDNPVIEIRSLGGRDYHNINSMQASEARQFADELIGVLTYIKNKEKAK